jgi:hypothetical protein
VQEVVRFQPFRTTDPVPVPCIDGTDVACAYHAGNRAEAPCRRCGSFLCPLCITPVAGETYCPGCFDRLRAARELPALRNQVPRPHTAAFVVALAALVPFAVVFAVPPAAWLTWRAVRARREIAVREPRWWLHVAAAALVLLCGAAVAVATCVETRPLYKASGQILIDKSGGGPR